MSAADKLSQLEQLITKTYENLMDIEDEMSEINQEYSIEVAKLQYQFDLKRQSLYEKRDGLIEKIPQFWAIAIQNHSALEYLINEEFEEDLIDALISLRVTRPEAKEDETDITQTYILTMKFKENPYLKTTEIVKEIQVINEDTSIIKNITNVEWTPEAEQLFNPMGQSSSVKSEDGQVEVEDEGNEANLYNFISGKGDGSEIISALVVCDLYPHAFAYYQGPEDEEMEDDYEDEMQEGDQDLDESSEQELAGK